MTERDFTALVRSTTKGKNANRAFGYVFAAEVGKPIDPLHVEGLFDLGRPVSIPEFIKNTDKEKIVAGLPGGLLMNLPKEDIQEMAFVFDMFRLETLQLSTANVAKIVPRYSSTGQTTISSATKTSGTVASATGLHKGETVIVGTRHLTYGGFDEMTVITAIDGTSVEFEPLSVVPSNGATFKKVAGKVTGADKTDTGIYIPNALTLEYPRRQLVIVFNIVSSRSLMVIHIPEFEVTGGTKPNFADSLAKCGFSGNPIIQPEKAFLLEDGTTENLPWYDDTYLVTYEIAA